MSRDWKSSWRPRARPGHRVAFPSGAINSLEHLKFSVRIRCVLCASAVRVPEKKVYRRGAENTPRTLRGSRLRLGQSKRRRDETSQQIGRASCREREKRWGEG